ncbi:MAG: PEP-CTERM/exosortase system-associated acyltransferase, partial [Candidatus Omnitrophica bacterium]|nr:PEP-CTERM/exosortase system-associated acyltransferase [Candidatus Omnitrophota bacterium]
IDLMRELNIEKNVTFIFSTHDKIGNTEFVFSRGDGSPELMDQIYRLRYQVYCNECNFIKAADYPSKSESDKYDPFSIHFTIQDDIGVIGTTRLILDNPYGLPFVIHCADTLSVDIGSFDKTRICEVSRLAISKRYRKRKDDGLYYANEDVDSDRKISLAENIKRIKPMTFGMYREIYQECKRRGITHFFALMEKTLWMLLRMHNFNFTPIGPDVEFYGKVRPYMCDIGELEKNVYAKAYKFYEYFLDGLEDEYRPKFDEPPEEKNE